MIGIHTCLRAAAALGGAGLAGGTLVSALRSLVLPRSENVRLTRFVFWSLRGAFRALTWPHRTFAGRDRVMALYAPVGLLTLALAWLALELAGYACLYWGWMDTSWGHAFRLSGSSLLTLGFTAAADLPTTALAFSEAAVGLILVALLISYLPTIYTAFSRRERMVSLLEFRAGAPPSGVEMLARFHRLGGLERIGDFWADWEGWFADTEESHTSLVALALFRSPQPGRSWITAAGAVLDAAALADATLDLPPDYRLELCLRAGATALRRIGASFGLRLLASPDPAQPISVTRKEFDKARERLAGAGLALAEDAERAWERFVGWRQAYDAPLLGLARLTMAPEAPWSSDRAARAR